MSATTARKSADTTTAPGIIRAGEVYTLKEFAKRLSLRRAAMRALRRNGLKVRRLGRAEFILGDDFIDHLKTSGELVP